LAGVLCAVVTLAYASSFATLIFGGALAEWSGVALWSTLIASAITITTLSFLSSLPFALGGPDSNPSAILAISVGMIAAEVLREAGPAAPQLLPTVFMFLFCSTTLCGLLLLLFGLRGWGRYVRYIPHQVIGGFLAGTGYLLVAGAWKMQTGSLGFSAVPPLAWIVAPAVGLTLLVATRFSRHPLVIPGILVAGVLVFHLARVGIGLSLEDARAAGLLLGPVSPGDWQHPWNQSWTTVRWDLVLVHANDFAAMSLVVLVTILLNTSGIDLATGHEADVDRELRALGVANVLGGLAGGIVSVNSLNRSLLNHRAGGTSPWSARVCAVCLLAGAGFFPGTLSLLPRPVLTGLVLYLGLSLLLTWLWNARRELPRADYACVVAILVFIAVLGAVPGVLLGVVVASMSFVVSFSRQSVVKVRFDASTRRSNVERTPEELAWLAEHGGNMNGFVLQGTLFFGTASSLLEELRPFLAPGRLILLDFWQVRGADASGVVVLRKLLRLANERGTQLAFSGVQHALRERLAACGLRLEESATRIFADLDRALEWSESQLLVGARPRIALGEALLLGDDRESELLESFFHPVELSAGRTLFHRGDPSNALYVLLEGQVSVYLHANDSAFARRLRSYGPGTIVGEMGLYNGGARSADVVADRPTRLARLDHEALRRLEASHPALAASLHRFVVNTLAARLRAANDELSHAI
jgi:SulP family sulfate permease